ncbi:cAMP-dependent protein kinase catalytic subunit alpha-like [Hippocampus zosterae]|uniref:cAMP-dependent protein kinase catalytic subunit alpha-like n=1 Tax=Hippocampus zosterae TaxID=109293 RepID=UPI00223D92F4|nr:cAMP-dependent protein kinase catalytic subunit alpha-like [Hippocampus zosterae]
MTVLISRWIELFLCSSSSLIDELKLLWLRLLDWEEFVFAKSGQLLPREVQLLLGLGGPEVHFLRSPVFFSPLRRAAGSPGRQVLEVCGKAKSVGEHELAEVGGLGLAGAAARSGGARVVIDESQNEFKEDCPQAVSGQQDRRAPSRTGDRLSYSQPRARSRLEVRGGTTTLLRPVKGFQKLNVLGKGAFGKVWLVSDGLGRLFAMKEMSKLKVLKKESVQSVLNERLLLEELRHPFLVNMVQAFQTARNLYLILEYESGGDLRAHMLQRGRFSEEHSRFFMANLVLAVEYLHSCKVIHRDIKPENIVVTRDHFLKLTDLGISVVQGRDRLDSSGTPGYMSPEAICSHEQGLASDMFALGVIAFELMFGRRPYTGGSRKEIRDKILSHQVAIALGEIPEGWSVESADFINQLLQRKPEQRLGWHGVVQVKAHPFLRDFPWGRLSCRELRAPYRGKVSAAEQGLDTEEPMEGKVDKALFRGYTFASGSDDYF